MSATPSVLDAAEVEELKARLARLEAEMKELRSLVVLNGSHDPNWVQRIAGGMKDYPEWEELCREAREMVEATDPFPNEYDR